MHAVLNMRFGLSVRSFPRLRWFMFPQTWTVSMSCADSSKNTHTVVIDRRWRKGSDRQVGSNKHRCHRGLLVSSKISLRTKLLRNRDITEKFSIYQSYACFSCLFKNMRFHDDIVRLCHKLPCPGIGRSFFSSNSWRRRSRPLCAWLGHCIVRSCRNQSSNRKAEEEKMRIIRGDKSA